MQLPPTIKSLNEPRDKKSATPALKEKASSKVKKSVPTITRELDESKISASDAPDAPDDETAPPPPTPLETDSSTLPLSTPPAPEAISAPNIPTGLTNSRLRASPSLELTLFSRLLELHGPGIRRMLTVTAKLSRPSDLSLTATFLQTQYRFNEKIMQFPSEALYDGELIAAASVKDRVLSDLPGVEPDEDLDEPVVFIDSG